MGRTFFRLPRPADALVVWVDLGVASALQVPYWRALRGGARFADGDTRTALDTRFRNLGPRIGIAYKITPKTVLRTGSGIFYSIPRGNASGITGGSTDIWNYYTSAQTYAANGATPFARFSDPFPLGGPSDSSGNSLRLAANIGLDLRGEVRTRNEIPQIQTWSFGFQRGLQSQAAYAWAKSIHNSSIVSGSTGLQGGSTSLQNPTKRFLERSLSQYDIPPSLQLAYTWDVPFGRGRLLGREWNAWINTVFGGWMTTGMWMTREGECRRLHT